MERRRLGKTGHQSSVVTFGTYAIGNAAQDDADRAIAFALAHGINHFDVAPSYAEAELRLGDYLKRHPQPDLFVGCKTEKRDAAGARDELLRTIDRLGRDRLDLYQLHAVGDIPELDRCFAPGGSWETFLWAKEEGLVAHLGITGHGPKAPAAHAEALRRYPRVRDRDGRLQPRPPRSAGLPRATGTLSSPPCQADDVGIHVLKATAKAPWAGRTPTHNTWYEPLTDQGAIDRAVAWALDQPVTTLCSSGDLEVFPKIVAAAERYRPGSGAGLAAEITAIPGYADIFVAAD